MKLLFFVVMLLNSFFSHSISDSSRYTSQLRKNRRDRLESKYNIPRLNVKSPWFYVRDRSWQNSDQYDVALWLSYAGWDKLLKKRISYLGIIDKALDMIENANHEIIATTFLFDNFLSGGTPGRDVVAEITNALIAKKDPGSDSFAPGISIAFMLDPANRAYADRISDKVALLRNHGIDVFYTDLISTKAASRFKVPEANAHFRRLLSIFSLGLTDVIIDTVSSKFLRRTLKKVAPEGVDNLDGKHFSWEMLQNASLLKSNHRKVLVTDYNDSYEALVSSANPHNASIPNANSAMSIRGDLAKYIYGVLRQDVAHSILVSNWKLLGNIVNTAIGSEGRKFVLWHEQASLKYKRNYLKQNFPNVLISELDTGVLSSKTPVKIKLLTEANIKKSILSLLAAIGGNRKGRLKDDVRIQMFYLSDIEVVEAIKQASLQLKNPIRLILGPNLHSFGTLKDGTPNRQVADYLVKETKQGRANVAIRWYSTHGEQNHAKIMSITNDDVNENRILTGSANWTGKNLKNINMEANLLAIGSKHLNDSFNKKFDMFWENSGRDNLEYTLPYEVYDVEKSLHLKLAQDKIDFKLMAPAKRQCLIEESQKEYNDLYEIYGDEDVALKLVLGRKMFLKMTEKNQKKHTKSYVDQWRKGEKSMLVMW